MKKTVIYDYEKFEDAINEIIEKSESNTYPIIEINNNWKTECNLPIKHYSIGIGMKHIVFFAAFHGAEIISTEFLIYVMNYIVENEKYIQSGENEENIISYIKKYCAIHQRIFHVL